MLKTIGNTKSIKYHIVNRKSIKILFVFGMTRYFLMLTKKVNIDAKETIKIPGMISSRVEKDIKFPLNILKIIPPKSHKKMFALE